VDESDYDTFERAFRKLGTALRLRVKEADMKELVNTYFRVLNGARLDAVLAGAKVCLTKCKAFPKPVEWLDAIPKTVPGRPVASDYRTLSPDEAAEWSRAERLCYEDAPCQCALCQTAGVTHRPLRFVPQFTADDRDELVIHPNKPRPVTAGHWAHGEEFARWYRAKEEFYALAAKHGMYRVAQCIGQTEKKWKTSNYARMCGRCGVTIPKQTAYQGVQLPNVSRELVRCATCAGEREPGEEG